MRCDISHLSRRGLLAAMVATAGCSGRSTETGETTTPAATTATTSTNLSTESPPRQSATESTPTLEPVDVREWPEEFYQGPLVSTHEHMSGPDGFWMTSEKLDWFVSWMQRNRVVRAMAITNEQIAPVIEPHDDRLVPFLSPYIQLRDEFERLSAALEDLLDRHDFYEGLGEFGLYRAPGPDRTPPIPANHPRLLEVYDLAADRDIPVMVHGGRPTQYEDPTGLVTDMEAAFEHNRDCTFLVHSTFYGVTIDGESNLPIGEAVDTLLNEHSNLYFDISGANTSPYSYRYNEGPDDDYDTVNRTEKKSQEWFESKLQADGGVDYHASRLYDLYGSILENHPDRVTWGMDASWQWHFNDWAMDTWIDVARALLGKLPQDKADQVGYKTAADLFGISIDQDS
mgnify:CR=1 FL=1